MAVIVNGVASVTVDIIDVESVDVTVGASFAMKTALLFLFYEPSALETASWMMRVDDNVKCLLVAMCIVDTASF